MTGLPPPGDPRGRWPAPRRPAARPPGRRPGHASPGPAAPGPAAPGRPRYARTGPRREVRADAGPPRGQPARIAALWALALDRFHDYMQARRATDMPDQELITPAGLDTAGLRRGYTELDDLARGGGFGPPPPGEWDAEHMLAHLASTDAAIAAAALAIAAGLRPAYDNRANIDESNLRRIIAEAGGLPGLADLVRRHGSLLCSIAGQLSGDVLDVRLPVLIVSGDQVQVDEPRPLRALLDGVGRFHLPAHVQQLRDLRRAGAGRDLA
jgi:hypothetical protein